MTKAAIYSRAGSAVERYDLRDADLELACRNAERRGLQALLVASRDVAAVRGCLGDAVAVISAVAYPSGALPLASKEAEARAAIADGADALCMVADCGAFRDGRTEVLVEELAMLTRVADERPRFLCIESSIMTDDQMEQLVQACTASGIAALLIATGFAGYGIERAAQKEVARARRIAAARLAIADFAAGAGDAAIADLTILPQTMLGADRPLGA